MRLKVVKNRVLTDNFSKALVTSLMMTTAMSFYSIGVRPAVAQEDAQKNFAIPAGPLNQALTSFGRQAGLQVSYLASVASGKTSPGVSGRLSNQAALARLLQGSGLEYSFINATTVSISHASNGSSTTQSADGSILLDTITVTNNLNAAMDATYSSAGSSTYLSQKKIEQFRGMSTGDFLKGQAGVMTGDNRNSGAVDINIRGMQGFGRVPVVVDGAQQQNTVYRGYSGVASRNYIDPDMIGGVEIVKGPSSGVYGVGATGGVAVMRTLNADDILKEGQNYGFRVRGSMIGNTSTPPPEGTKGGLPDIDKSFLQECWNGCAPTPIPDELLNTNISSLGPSTGLNRPALLKPTSGSGSVAFASRWENLELLAAYSRRKIGNYHAGKHGNVPDKLKITDRLMEMPNTDIWFKYKDVSLGGLNRYRAGEEVLNTSQDNTSYLFKGKLELDDGHTFDVGYMKYKSIFGELMPSIIIRFDGAQQAPLSEVEVDSYTTRYNWNPDNDLINLTANLWHTKTETQIRTPYNFGMFDRTGYWDVAKRTGGDVSNESKFSSRWGDVTLNYGGSYTYETLAPPSDIEKLAGTVTNNEIARDGWRKEGSAFVSGEWKVNDWLKLDGALRYSKTHSYDRNARQVPAPGESTDTAPWYNNEERSSGFAPIM